MKQYILRSICAGLVFCTACSPKIYFPERTNAPMLREAGDVRLTSSLKIQNNTASTKMALSPSFDFAVSPVKGLGIIASFRSTSRYSDEEDWGKYNQQDSIHYSGNRGEFGLGYYLPFGKRGLFEIYGGAGFGSANRDNLKHYEGGYQSRYTQFFLQPEIGFNVKDIFEMCGGIKFSYHKYHDFKTQSPDVRYMFTDPQTDIESNTFVFVGPFVNLNAGYQYIKFNAQFGANFNAGTPQLVQGNSPFYLSLGMTFAFAPRFLNKK